MYHLWDFHSDELVELKIKPGSRANWVDKGSMIISLFETTYLQSVETVCMMDFQRVEKENRG